MTQEEYIKQCGVTSADELSSTQLLRYFCDGNGGIINRITAMSVKQKRIFGCDIDINKSMSLMLKAFKENKTFEIHFIEGEGVVIDNKYPGPPHFEYILR